jgi:hypothetical protein
VLYPIPKVSALIERFGMPVFFDKVLQGAPPPLSIKGVALVGDLQNENTASTEHAIPAAQRRERKRHVFEDVTGNHEIQAAVGERKLAGVG